MFNPTPFACAFAATLLLSFAAIGCSGDGPAPTPAGGSAAPPVVTTPGAAGATPPPSSAAGTGAVVTAGAQSVGPNVPTPAAGSAAAPAATGGTSAPSRPVDMNPLTPGQAPTAATSDWSTMGYDPGSTYFNRAETKLTKANAAQLAVAYTADMGSPVYGAPLQIGDKIYASSTTTTKSLDAATGKELWSVMTGTQGSLSYGDGTLYLNLAGSRMMALNAADGKQLWTKSYSAVAADGISSAIVAGDLVLVGGSNGGIELGGGAFRGFVSAIDRKTGETVWSTPTVPKARTARRSGRRSPPMSQVASRMPAPATTTACRRRTPPMRSSRST